MKQNHIVHSRLQRRPTPWERRSPAVPLSSAGKMRIPWGGSVSMRTILLADHNAEYLKRHSDILCRAGYRIVTVQDGRSALFILESGMMLDLIVTEYEMPDMGSRELLAALRHAAPLVPVIVATSCTTVESYIHAVNLGVFEFLNKPLLPGELRGMVKSAITARQTAGFAGLA